MTFFLLTSVFFDFFDNLHYHHINPHLIKGGSVNETSVAFLGVSCFKGVLSNGPYRLA